MSRTFSILFAIALFGHSGIGQSANCPAIYVDGPNGIPVHGEPIPYRVRVEPPEKAVGLSFLWSIVTRNGPVGMVRGQGTTQIEVPFTYDNVTSTVKIIGLPEGCANTASETMSIDPGPVASKLHEASGSPSKLPKSLIDSIRLQMSQIPNSRLFITVSPGKSGSARSKISLLNRRLALKANGLEGRTKIVASDRKDETIIFWLVPQGAEYPKP